MKLITAITLAITLFAVGAKATVKVTKTGGGPNGYYNVNEVHTTTPAPGGYNDVLDCNNPGNSACSWTTKPGCDIIYTAQGPISISQNVDPVIVHQLDNGVKSGSLSYSPYLITWQGNDANNYELTVTPAN